MPESFARVADDVELCFETFGDDRDPTLLLVMGLGTQMVAWRADFCEQLVGRGFRVVRFDNRDCGRSSRIAGRPPTVAQLLRRDTSAARYTLSDMAADAAGLLDHLGVDSAHVTGASMGGMIAQMLAAESPERVRSLVSIMSTTGNRWVGQPSPRLYPVLLRNAPRDRDRYVEYVARLYGAIGSPGFPLDHDEIRRLAGESFDRGVDAAATGRQLAAILASGDRTAKLRQIRAPTLVIHGTADRLVRRSGGRATARAIPGAQLMTIDGMAHDLPRAVWPRLIDGIVRTADRAGQRLAGGSRAAA